MKRALDRDERMTVVQGILCIVLVIVVLQLWLLTAAMNAYLGGDESVIWPAAAGSCLAFALNAGLLWHLYGLERPRQP
jgi:hypothetical protein